MSSSPAPSPRGRRPAGESLLLPPCDYLGGRARLPAQVPGALAWSALTAHEDAELAPLPVPFDHPLWVVFSSGTTGRPKGMVHGHGGVVLEQLKNLGLQLGLRAGDRLLWHHTELDDVERPGVRPAAGRHRRVLRGQPGPSRH
ncbi:AMP-binding protein [Streptomyces sparsogenes]|uniref:AMP-binding protein n=1 Tax=Streptomyces sparsogenes TaxID=67365 RepID=UPI003F4D64B7